MEYKDQEFHGERALFKQRDASIKDCIFVDGESPLKESRDIEIDSSTFCYKYPLWYSQDIEVKRCKFEEMSRSGIWYTKNIAMNSCDLIAPKLFRYCKDIKIEDTEFKDGKETLWHCLDIEIKNVKTTGDYFGYNSSNIRAVNLTVDGNYAFDSCKNIEISDSTFNSKDAFWNCENVRLTNCTLIGEYLAWNSKNITFKDCYIVSHQGLCYIKNMTIKDCKIVDSDLILEYCEEISVDCKSDNVSIKNPISGVIRINKAQFILDDNDIDKNRCKIEITGGKL